MGEWEPLEFTPQFMQSLERIRLRPAEFSRFLRGLTLLAENERHPSLRIHQMKGDQAGLWTASLSDVLRVRYRKLPDGKKLLVDLTQHYDV